MLIPEIVISKPEGLPDPCTCGKCVCRNVCRYRVAGLQVLQMQGKRFLPEPILMNEVTIAHL